jgi:hypothetical protein
LPGYLKGAYLFVFLFFCNPIFPSTAISGLKPGGLIIFDDYHYLPKPPKEYSPTGINFLDVYLWRKKTWEMWSEPAVDAFLKVYGPYLEVVFKKYQVVVRKKLEN